MVVSGLCILNLKNTQKKTNKKTEQIENYLKVVKKKR